ncbi:AMED_5909 family protein [Amycolatopsis palatopharyngis]|uniref:AMED_5909 family protein n=1 Tax=Amycolatopsis palatopharyngis TaxID=187982 RepID=UPI001FE73EDA|nr:AMED_5909 family protein [Amycolatopsis palatopharyngis]
MNNINKQRELRTLMQAHEVLSSMRPSEDAPLPVWRDYYRRSAATYARIAEIDRGHHHEALYWADRENLKADEISKRLASTEGTSAR